MTASVSARPRSGNWRAPAPPPPTTPRDSRRRKASSIARRPARRWFRRRQLGALGFDLRSHRGRQSKTVQMPIQCALEDSAQQCSEHRDSQQTGDARNGIVDSRRGAGVALIDGVHHGRGQRGHADRHAQPQHQHRREERGPVGPADARSGEQRKSDGRDQRADHQRSLGAISIEKSARPARQQKHQQNERQQSGSGLRWRIALHLDQIEREKEEHAAQGGVEKEGAADSRR